MNLRTSHASSLLPCTPVAKKYTHMHTHTYIYISVVVPSLRLETEPHVNHQHTITYFIKTNILRIKGIQYTTAENFLMILRVIALTAPKKVCFHRNYPSLHSLVLFIFQLFCRLK